MSRVAGDIMVSNPISIGPEQSLREVLNVMDTYGVSHLLVEKDDVLLGVISKSDLLRTTRDIIFQSSGKSYSNLLLDSIKAEGIMGRNLITVDVNEHENRMIELFLSTDIHCLPVLEGAKPIGIITFYDLLKREDQKELLTNQHLSHE